MATADPQASSIQDDGSGTELIPKLPPGPPGPPRPPPGPLGPPPGLLGPTGPPGSRGVRFPDS